MRSSAVLNGSMSNGYTEPAMLRFTFPPSPNGTPGEPPSANGKHGLPTTDAPSPNGADSRDSRGRFAKGNKGGPGNPFARRVGRLRSLLLDRVSDEDLEQIAHALVAKAKGGDVAAARLLFSYLLGRPGEAVDPDRLDADEWRLHQEAPRCAKR